MRILCLAAILLAACPPADDDDNLNDNTNTSDDDDATGDDDDDAGALVAVTLDSTVGVLLDEIPEAERERTATWLGTLGEDFWIQRASWQLDAASYRLLFRNFYYENRGQLPLPPRELWSFEFGKPERRTIDGHDVFAVDYSYSSVLLTGAGEPGLAEPLLEDAGGVWEEPYTLPVDPELLLERTGFACMNELDFPPNSVDTENARLFFDDLCEAGDDPEGCHLTPPIPTNSCVDAIEENVGRVETSIVFERLAWDSAVADAARVGVQEPGIAQLHAMQEGVDENRVVYRYFPASSCAISEGCVGGSGWRRLLQFTATVQNLGAVDAAIGDVGPGSGPVENHMVSFSECHQHMHFNHYGDFAFDAGEEPLGSKRAFCLESTWRYFNNEDTPLNHPYTCEYQGTAAGWGDDYIAGLDCQWVDVTPVDTTAGPVTADLTFHVNPDGFLCEGVVQTDAAGNTLYEERPEFQTEAGDIESAIACDEVEGWADDNIATASVTLPQTGGMVTSPCGRNQLGEKRACGFELIDDDITCEAGTTFQAICTVANPAVPMVVRTCEASHGLDAGTACTFREATAGGTVTTSTTFTVNCPAARDEVEVGGRMAIYTAPAIPSDTPQEVSCAPVGGGE